MTPIRIAVAGAGLIGRRHIEIIQASTDAVLAAVVDPSPMAEAVAHDAGVPLYSSLEDLLSADRPDAVILATPNTLHASGGLTCIDAGVPILVEKPIADTLENAQRLVDAASEKAIPLLVGHHRRHSPLLATAARIIAEGKLGPLVAVMGSALFYKPDDYFDAAPWRREAGGGPILINMIHEVDNLQALCGDIVTVQAIASNNTRGFPVEDTVSVNLGFANGALGSFILSDTAASARSWEQTSGENTSYPSYPDEDCYLIAGTRGSLAIPSMKLKTYSGTQSWWTPFELSVATVERADPLVLQLKHFVSVVRGETQPLVDGPTAMQSLRVTEAIAEAVNTGRTISISPVHQSPHPA